jgi:LmbE family N-acetylglucosaminyl deacetylase/glycosyltransferase involved in cell wall biosynthesis
MKMRVLMVTRERAADRRYGLGKSLSPLLEVFPEIGVSWVYLCQEDAGERGWRILRRLHGLFSRPLSWVLRGTEVPALLWGVLERLNMGRLAAHAVRREAITHVHCHDPLIALGFWLFSMGRRRSVRWGITEHGFGSYTQAIHEDGARLGWRTARLLRRIEAMVLSRADWVFAPTRAALDQLARDLALGHLPSHWHAVPHALAGRSTLTKSQARARLGWRDGETIVLAVGRLVPLKGFEQIIGMLARSDAGCWRLCILGDGDRDALLELARRLGVQERVQIESTDDVWVHYAAADVYLSASRTESFGLANLEAISAGLPAICTAVGGVPEVVGAAAVLVARDDEASMLRWLNRLLSDRGLRESLSAAGLALGAAWPSAGQIASACREVYLGGCVKSLGHPVVDGESKGELDEKTLFRPMQELTIPEGLKVMVLAPHADDEVIGCGGTIARVLERGGCVEVVIVSDGRLGDPAGHCAEDIGALRRREAEAAARELGLTSIRFLGMPDGMLDSEPRLRESLSAAVQAFEPDWIFVPSSEDAHLDHRAVANAAFDLLSGMNGGRRCFEYEVWVPVAADWLVDVTEVYPLKERALARYELPLRYKDYLTSARGLACYRGMQLEAVSARAEAFREIRPRHGRA